MSKNNTKSIKVRRADDASVSTKLIIVNTIWKIVFLYCLWPNINIKTLVNTDKIPYWATTCTCPRKVICSSKGYKKFIIKLRLSIIIKMLLIILQKFIGFLLTSYIV